MTKLLKAITLVWVHELVSLGKVAVMAGELQVVEFMSTPEYYPANGVTFPQAART